MSLETRLVALVQAIGAAIKLRGLPAGGTAGQFPRKASGTDYDTAWAALSPADVPGVLTYADAFADAVVSGLTTPTSATLTSTTAAGVAYLGGTRATLGAVSKTYTASRDTYVDLTSSGTFTYTEVTVGAAAPALTAGSVRVAKVTTSASAVTTVTDLRAFPLRYQLTVTADGALQTTGTGQAGSVAGNARGQGAVDLQTTRTGAAQVASGANSAILGGRNNTASGTSVVVMGDGNTASASYTTALGGGGNTVSSNYAVSIGGANNTASALFTSVNGFYARATRYGQRAHSSGQFAASGDNQYTRHVLRMATTDATPTQLTLDGAAPSAQGRLTLAAGQTIGFTGLLEASTSAAGVTAGWEIKGRIKRPSTAGTTALVGTPTVTSLGADSGASAWAVAVTADTTNGCLVITVTGAAATTIRWSLGLRAQELTF